MTDSRSRFRCNFPRISRNKIGCVITVVLRIYRDIAIDSPRPSRNMKYSRGFRTNELGRRKRIFTRPFKRAREGLKAPLHGGRKVVKCMQVRSEAELSSFLLPLSVPLCLAVPTT